MKTAEEIVFPRVEFPNYSSKALFSSKSCAQKAPNVLSVIVLSLCVCV